MHPRSTRPTTRRRGRTPSGRPSAPGPSTSGTSVLRAEPDVAYELLRTSEEGLDHPQVPHNGEVVTLDAPGIGPVEQVGPVARFQATPARITRSAPALGETHGPLTTAATTTTTGGSGPAPAHPLAGFTIVEFGYFFAMPFATAWPPPSARGSSRSKTAVVTPCGTRSAHRTPGRRGCMEGKESLSVDLRTPEGRQLVHDLVAEADAFVNGFRPGVAERQGVDYDDPQEDQPEPALRACGRLRDRRRVRRPADLRPVRVVGRRCRGPARALLDGSRRCRPG